MRRQAPGHYYQFSIAIAALAVCTLVIASPTGAPQSSNVEPPTQDASITPTDTNATATTNFNCPEDCHCVIARNTHKPFLHAKCSSIDGLKSDEPLEATLPIHSIDLSYLSLPRLPSHTLEKLHDLTSIDLSHNELHEIGHLGRRIKKLNLKHNRLTSNKLSKLPQHVQVLNLQHNDITYLPLEFMHLAQLKTLELSHNEINCSCDTLTVRNWLQVRNVFMEHPIKCSYPVEVKNKSWLQVKQSEICDKERYGWHESDDENDLMMGDEPIEGSAETDDDEELGKDFMPIASANPTKSEELSTPEKSEEVHFADVEGSGDLNEMNLPLGSSSTTLSPVILSSSTEDENSTIEDGDDGSGSGAGIFIVPQIASEHVVTDDFDSPRSDETNDDDFDNKPVEQPEPDASASPDIFGNGMGIFPGGTDEPIKSGDPQPIEEEAIVPVVHYDKGADNLPTEDVSTEGPGDSDVLHAEVGKKDDSNATYFLLGVIVLIVVGLILFVAIKRCKLRHTAGDAENPRQTELLDMDKKNLGKPKHQNGTEQAPLIGEKTKSDLAKPINGSGTKPYDSNDIKDGPTQQQPLLNGSGNGTTPAHPADDDDQKANGPSQDQAPHEYYPITPRYPTPKSPRASKYAQYPQREPNNNNADDAYLSSSPKSGRYSPVYSPETGRVKIKLTETPKPKTPMLVTRSKSNAGDIITTPVHIPASGGVSSGANGYVQDH